MDSIVLGKLGDILAHRGASIGLREVVGPLRSFSPFFRASLPIRLLGPQHSSTKEVCLGAVLKEEEEEEEEEEE